MDDEDLKKHLMSLKKPHRDKQFSYIMKEEPDKQDEVKKAVKDVKRNVNTVSEKAEKLEQTMV